MFEVLAVCSTCSQSTQMNVEEKDFFSFLAREKSAQDAFPYLSAGERELFISGTCSECFDKLFQES